MKYLETKGVACHLLEDLSPQESLVLALEMFPIECVVRNFAAGSICKRLGLKEGQKFQDPIFEFFYNFLMTKVHTIKITYSTYMIACIY